MVEHGGIATMPDIYHAVEAHLKGQHLSDQGRASLRRLINSAAVQAGFVYPHDRNNPGWRLTPEGRDFVSLPPPLTEVVINVDTRQEELKPSNSVRGTALELYMVTLLKEAYPRHAWYHQGLHKQTERGLDIIASRFGANLQEPASIGVQVKFHAVQSAPTQLEWLKFFAGCFARHIDHPIFVTTGRLTAEQRREAGEGRVIVIEGREEITRLATAHEVPPFELFIGDKDAAEDLPA
jgi:hypothetical protein